MKRRDFLKSTLLFAAVSTAVAKATGIFTESFAAGVAATPGKLGYKEVSPQKEKGKLCSTCKHFKAGDAGAGQCVLPAMQSAMKSKEVIVKADGYCNMWAKKA
ncbi:MAG TPA: hypothetical protein VNJ01_00250 [Bacteriovoracaceae bacterium]|nr:hypothetical protein [Bacteriovoracaceae bacterium]